MFTIDGSAVGGDRVRVHHWIKRGALAAQVHTFSEGLPVGNHERYIKHPVRTMAAHLRVSALARKRFEGVSVIYRQVSPFSRGRIERNVLRRSAFGIVDFDDALHLDHGGSGVRAFLAPSVKARLVVESSDRVVAGNEFLAEWASKFCRDVVVIPSCVEPRDYTQKNSYDLARRPRIGWIGSHSTERYLDLIEGPLLQANRDFGAKLVIVGAAGNVRPNLEPMVERHAWTEKSAHQLASTFDVGIMPLADTPYESGKCGYKLLQYAAAGLPVIASPVGVNRSILERFGSSSPETPPDWTGSLTALLGASSAERMRLGSLARAAVIANFSYDRWQPDWISAMSGL